MKSFSPFSLAETPLVPKQELAKCLKQDFRKGLGKQSEYQQINTVLLSHIRSKERFDCIDNKTNLANTLVKFLRMCDVRSLKLF